MLPPGSEQLEDHFSTILQYRSLQGMVMHERQPTRKTMFSKNHYSYSALRNGLCTGVSTVSLKPFILSISRLWHPFAKPQSESSTDTIAQLFRWRNFSQLGSRASMRKLAPTTSYQPANDGITTEFVYISPKESYPANILTQILHRNFQA